MGDACRSNPDPNPGKRWIAPRPIEEVCVELEAERKEIDNTMRMLTKMTNFRNFMPPGIFTEDTEKMDKGIRDAQAKLYRRLLEKVGKLEAELAVLLKTRDDAIAEVLKSEASNVPDSTIAIIVSFVSDHWELLGC